MLPQLSAHEVAARERVLSCVELVAVILAFLPLRERLACAAVRAQWRAALRERGAWTRYLKVDPSCSDGVLRAAAHKAGGMLQALDVSGSISVTPAALLAVVAANAASLRELRGVGGPCVSPAWQEGSMLRHDTSCETLDALVCAAPRLRVLDASVQCTGEQARRLLRSAPPYERVRVREMFLRDYELRDGALTETLASIAAHAPLTRLLLCVELWAPAALDAVVDLALARRLKAITFYQCSLGGDWGSQEGSLGAPAALARLLGGDALADLHFLQEHSLVYPRLDLTPLCAALRGSTALQSLTLDGMCLWSRPAAAAALLGALVAHSTLQTLNLGYNGNNYRSTTSDAFIFQQAEAAIPALEALIAADTPALTALNFEDVWLGHAGANECARAV
jgi:hypothetical protein